MTFHQPTLSRRPSASCRHRHNDRDLVAFVGRHGAVSIEQVMSASGIGQTAAYRRVAGLVAAGLLERLQLLRGEPTLLKATRQGLRYAGLGMAPAVISPGSIAHWLRCTSAAIDLEAASGPHRVITVRELIAAERHEERPIASAVIGRLPDGRPRLHRPDLVVLPEGHPLVKDEVPLAYEDPADHGAYGRGPTAHARTPNRGREITGDVQRAPGGAEDVRLYTERASAGTEDMGVCAYEVELTPKSPKRLREIIRGWRRADCVDRVHYLCEPGPTRRAVERAVARLGASDRVAISEVAA